jgi:hypothetical protein
MTETNAITVAAAAERLQISPKAVRQYANDNKLEKVFIPGVKGGHPCYLITVDSILKYQEEKRRSINRKKDNPVGYQPKRIQDWTTYSEKTYVRHLGTGKWSPGSDLRHRRDWWLKQYLKATEELTDAAHIRAGRREAKLILSEIRAGITT